MSNTAATLNTISRYLNFTLAVPIITFGIIGSILTIIIFIKRPVFWNNPTITYLLAGAIMTIIHLPTIYLAIILASGFETYIMMKNDISCKLFNYFLYVTTAAAISFPCWAAFDQYACTNRDANFRHRWSSMRFVRRAIFGTILFWLIFYLPLFILTNINAYGCSIEILFVRQLNNYVCTPLVFTILPVILVAFFMHEILKNLRSTIIANRHTHLERQIRRMMTPQVVFLAVSGFPFGLESFYLEYTADVPKSEIRSAIETLILQILRLFYHVNFVCTFYIYFYISNEVRRPIKEIVDRLIPINRVTPAHTTISFELNINNNITN